MRHWIRAAVSAALLLVSAEARADDPQWRQQERHEDRQRELERNTPPRGGVEIVPAPGRKPGSGPCRIIARIEVTGADRLPAAALAEATAPFAGRCLTAADLNSVVDAVNAAYLDRGYVTSRAYLPEQDLSAGTLRLRVAEGTVEEFGLERREGAVPVTAFPGQAGGILDLRALEQGLDQINRLPSWNARMRIAPGSVPGSSRVIVSAPPGAWPLKGWLRGQAFVENGGGDETGRLVGHVALAADDLLGLLDGWSAEYQRNPSSVHGGPLSQGLSVDVSVPWGSWTGFGGFRFSDYRYRVEGRTRSFGLSGWSQRASLGVNHVLFRDGEGKIAAEAEYILKRTGAALEDVELRSGTRDLASVSARLEGAARLWGGAWYATFGLRRGLGSLGTDLRLPAAPGGPGAEYWQPSLDLDGFQPLEIGGLSLLWRPGLHLEYADRTLFGTDRLFIGGLYTVRGFRDTGLSGDRGGTLRNDLSWTLPATGDGLADAVFAAPELYLGLDAGWAGTATGRELGESPAEGLLAGGAVGIRNTAGYAVADLSLARSFARAGLRDEGLLMSFRLGVRF